MNAMIRLDGIEKNIMPKTNFTKKITGAENFRKCKIGTKYYLKNKLIIRNFFIKKKFSNRKKTLC